MVEAVELALMADGVTDLGVASCSARCWISRVERIRSLVWSLGSFGMCDVSSAYAGRPFPQSALDVLIVAVLHLATQEAAAGSPRLRYLHDQVVEQVAGGPHDGHDEAPLPLLPGAVVRGQFSEV